MSTRHPVASAATSTSIRAPEWARPRFSFSHGDTEVFASLVDNLRYDDPFLVCADFASYLAAQEQVGVAWLDKDAWMKMSILNTARSGKFSSDRAIAEYCDEIWNVWPLSVTL